MVRVAVMLAGLASLAGAMPVSAEQLKPEEARRFVVGKLFTFNCFEGTRGTGRIQADGSVAGSIQFQGSGPVRYVMLPANTVRVHDERVCGRVKGMPFEACFNVDRTSATSFRGSLSGLGFAYCDFNRHQQPHRVRSVRRGAEVQAAEATPAN